MVLLQLSKNYSMIIKGLNRKKGCQYIYKGQIYIRSLIQSSRFRKIFNIPIRIDLLPLFLLSLFPKVDTHFIISPL